MRNFLKKSLLFIAACLMANSVWSASIYKTELKENPTGATTTFAKGEFITPPSWATGGYSSCFHTTGSAGEVTITFTTPIDLSGYSNCKFILIWGAESNRPVNLAINGGSATQIDAVASSAERSKVRTATSDLSVTSISSINLKGSGGGNSYYIQIEITGDAAGPVAVTGVTLNKNTTSIEAGQSEQLTAVVQPTNADNQTVTWSSSNPAVASVDENGLVSALSAGTANITVTTEDGNKTATCAVTVTTPAAPIPVTAIALSDATVAVGSTTTLTVTYTPADANTGKAISTWTSGNNAVATVANGVVTGISAGTTTITATTEGGKTASCTVTVNVVAVTGVSLDKTSANLQIGGSISLTATVTPANASNKTVTWNSSNPAVATVGNGVVSAVAEGSATITVASVADPTKTATCTVTVTAGTPVPQTSLTLHEPEVYEAKTKEGGYGGQLSIFDGYEYEVYYAGRWDNGGTKLTMHIDPIDKSHGVTKNETNSSYEAIDGWFKGSGADKGTGFAVRDEFEKSTDRCHTISSSNSVEIHIKGYDQFALYGADKKWSDTKPADRKYFKVLIDNVEQEMTPSTDQSIRRFNITTTEHVIKIIHSGGEQSLFGGFSLRVPQAPKIKHLKGNDSAQVVLQTMPINKIVYTCKYNRLAGAETRLIWNGPEAIGIALDNNIKQGDLVDTITLSGNANCPIGSYSYEIATYLNGAKTSSVTGHFEVQSDIRAQSSVSVISYQNEEMDQILFKYYALSADDVQVTWPQGKPQGTVDGYSTQPGLYIIGGTPTSTGTYPFEITVLGADTVIKGSITVEELEYGPNAVLYLYKNDSAFNNDGVYAYLKGGGTYNLIKRRTKLDGLRPSSQYSNYKWILISEDVDADNPEILALARGEGNLPVLNMKAFSYTKNRLNWGDPNNGSLTKDEGRFITVLRDDHPIFKAMNKKRGDRIQVLDSTGGKGLMPIAVNYTGTLCLATAHTRDINDYNGNGPEETFLHEVPAEMHRSQKYLCLPIGQSGSNYLHAEGKKLINECIKYILGHDATIQLPDLAINTFRIGSYEFKPEINEDKIVIEIFAKDSDMLKAASPVVTLASPMTHAYASIINEDGTVDIFNNWRFGMRYIVSDYINTRSYDISVRLKEVQGIDEIEAGEWINIYDIYGRKVATTNENFHTMDLPHGMYILVTESGKTLKVMR